MAEDPRNETDQSIVPEFADLAKQQQTGLVREFWDFLWHNKKWWLTPIIIVLLLFGILVSIGGPAAPFIYTLW